MEKACTGFKMKVRKTVNRKERDEKNEFLYWGRKIDKRCQNSGDKR